VAYYKLSDEHGKVVSACAHMYACCWCVSRSVPHDASNVTDAKAIQRSCKLLSNNH
jgi:hypothetical protein